MKVGILGMALWFWSSCSLAQYSYFSSFYEPPDYEDQNSGGLFNLFVHDSSLWCLGVAYADTSFGQWWIEVDSNTGDKLNDYFVAYSGFDPFYSWGDSYDISSVGGFLGTYQVDLDEPDSSAVYMFKLNLNGEHEWQSLMYEPGNDSTFVRTFIIRQLANSELLSCGVIRHEVPGVDQYGLFFARTDDLGEAMDFVEIPFWNEEYQTLFPHEQIFPTDMLELDNGEILVAGQWADSSPPPFVARPFIMKFSAELEFQHNFEFGNPDIDQYRPWLEKREDGKVMYAYAYGVDWDPEITTYPILNIHMGLYDPETMDSLWENEYPYQQTIQRVQDFEPTPDGGYVILVQGGDIEQDCVVLKLLKLDSNYEEEWYKTYYPPVNSADITGFDIEVTTDNGYAILSLYFDYTNEYQKAWLLKLDACGDEQWSGCPFIGIEESPEQQFNVFPNPFAAQLRLKLAEQASKVEVYNILGKLMNSFTAHREMTLNLSHLPAGAYIVCVRNESGVAMWSAPVVKE